MPTTVQVDEKTLQMLNKIKKEMKASSYDQVNKVVNPRTRKNSLFNVRSNRKLKPFTREDETEFHDFYVHN